VFGGVLVEFVWVDVASFVVCFGESEAESENFVVVELGSGDDEHEFFGSGFFDEFVDVFLLVFLVVVFGVDDVWHDPGDFFGFLLELGELFVECDWVEVVF
jgi:hypothetical protein